MDNSNAGQVFKWVDQNSDDVLKLDTANGTMLTLTGAFYATEKHFDIIDPRHNDESRRLIHGVLEGPENGVYYRGTVNVINDSAEIDLPDYFTSLASSESASVSGGVSTPKSSLRASGSWVNDMALDAVDPASPVSISFLTTSFE